MSRNSRKTGRMYGRGSFLMVNTLACHMVASNTFPALNPVSIFVIYSTVLYTTGGVDTFHNCRYLFFLYSASHYAEVTVCRKTSVTELTWHFAVQYHLRLSSAPASMAQMRGTCATARTSETRVCPLPVSAATLLSSCTSAREAGPAPPVRSVSVKLAA